MMIQLKKICLCAFVMLLTGCNNSAIDNVDRGAGYKFQPGFPELRVATTGYIAEDNSSHIIVSGDVVYGSLVYAMDDETYSAIVTIVIEIFENTKDRRKVDGIEFSQNITTKDQNIVNSQNVYSFEKDFLVKPGDYIIQTSIIDKRSGKQSLRRTETSIPDPEDATAHITEIRILGKDIEEHAEFIPITTYDVPSRFDTLQFVFQVTNNDPDAPIQIESKLLKYKSDTTAARPMHFNSPSPSSIEYQGIEYDKSKVIQRSVRELLQPGSVLIEFVFTDLEKGNYRLEIRSMNEDENDLFKARDFGIKSENYPSLKSPNELAKPLIYIMNEKEYENLMKIKDPEQLKRAIDRFWLSHINNSVRARQVIELYYQRVEEANKQFSNFKAGWKTDPGMIYILFGPPWYSDIFADLMTWSYSYNHEDPENNYVFDSPTIRTKYFPFDHFILRRSSFYYNIYYQQTERWRNGGILNVGR